MFPNMCSGWVIIKNSYLKVLSQNFSTNEKYFQYLLYTFLINIEYFMTLETYPNFPLFTLNQIEYLKSHFPRKVFLTNIKSSPNESKFVLDDITMSKKSQEPLLWWDSTQYGWY